MQVTDNTKQVSARQAPSPSVPAPGGNAGKQFAMARASSGASAGALEAAKKVDAQGLLKSLAAKGLKYDKAGLALSAGDAANVVIASNGGPITGKQLDVLLKSGFVKLGKESWSLDLGKLDGEQSLQVVGNILHSSSFNDTQRYRLLGHIGIVKAKPVIDVDTKALDGLSKNRTADGFSKSFAPGNTAMSVKAIKFLQKLSPWGFKFAQSGLDKTVVPYLLSGLTGGRITRSGLNSLVKNGTLKVNSKDMTVSIAKFNGKAAANTVAAILFDPQLSNVDRSVMMEKLGWSRAYQRKIETSLTGGKGANGYLEASDFGFNTADTGTKLNTTVRPSQGGGTPPRPGSPQIPGALQVNADELLARQIQRAEFVERYGGPLNFQAETQFTGGLPELDIVPNLNPIVAAMRRDGTPGASSSRSGRSGSSRRTVLVPNIARRNTVYRNPNNPNELIAVQAPVPNRHQFDALPIQRFPGRIQGFGELRYIEIDNTRYFYGIVRGDVRLVAIAFRERPPPAVTQTETAALAPAFPPLDAGTRRVAQVAAGIAIGLIAYKVAVIFYS